MVDNYLLWLEVSGALLVVKINVGCARAPPRPAGGGACTEPVATREGEARARAPRRGVYVRPPVCERARGGCAGAAAAAPTAERGCSASE